MVLHQLSTHLGCPHSIDQLRSDTEKKRKKIGKQDKKTSHEYTWGKKNKKKTAPSHWVWVYLFRRTNFSRQDLAYYAPKPVPRRIHYALKSEIMLHFAS